MEYPEVPYEHRDRIKRIAYQLDPNAWISYSGQTLRHKRYIETRRKASLEKAAGLFYVNDNNELEYLE